MDYQSTMSLAAIEYVIGLLQSRADELRGRKSSTTATAISTDSAVPKRKGRPPGRTVSNEAREKIRQAQQRRWALKREQEQLSEAPVVEEASAGEYEAPHLEEIPAAPTPVEITNTGKRGRKGRGTGD